jgi:hypothetical protein
MHGTSKSTSSFISVSPERPHPSQKLSPLFFHHLFPPRNTFISHRTAKHWASPYVENPGRHHATKQLASPASPPLLRIHGFFFGSFGINVICA